MRIITAMTLSLFMAASPSIAHEKTETYSQTTHYDVDIDNSFLMTLAIRAYLITKNMNWDELSVRTTFEKDKAGNEKVKEIILWPDNSEVEIPDESEIIFRLTRDPEKSSFINFLNKTKFKDSEILPLLDLYGYLYDKRAEDIKFESQNLFDNNPGNMRSKLSKKLNPDGNLVSIESMNASGNTNAWIDVTTKDKPEKLIEKISIRLKVGGIKVLLTEIEKDEK